MRVNGKMLGVVAAAAFLAACSDSPMAPATVAKVVKPSFITVDQIPAGFAPEVGKIKVCKVWDNPGAGAIPNTSIARVGNDVTPTAATLTLTAGPYVLGHNQCANVATSTEGNGIFDEVTLTETVPANSNLVLVQRFDFGGASSVIANGTAVGFNTFHGSTIVFTNHFTPPPPPRCTYTKGWYQSKHATDGEDRDIIAGVEGLSIADQSKIFNATPGKLGDVEIDGPNNLLNLYQQLLAALNNLNNNEDGGPTAVDNAIDAAQDGTSITAGLTISTTLTEDEIGALVSTLSSFNEGAFEGFGHCDD